MRSTSRSICVTRSMVPFFSTWRWSMPAICMAPALMTAWTAVARKSGAIGSATGRQLLHHAHFHAPFGGALQPHVVHEAAHEEDAAAAGLEHVLGRERIGDFERLEPLPLVGDLDHELGRRLDRREGELDRDEFAAVLAVAVLDCVDDRFADGDADPVDRVLVEGGHLPHAIAEDLDEIHHVEQARNLQPDQAAAHRHWRARIIQYSRPMSPTTGSAP